MRLSTAAIPALVVSCCAFGQTYTIQAFAAAVSQTRPARRAPSVW